MCKQTHQGSETTNQQGALPLKVTVLYEGSAMAIDEALHGPSRNVGQLEVELEQANTTLCYALGELNHMCEKAEDLAFDLAAEKRDGQAMVDAVKEDREYYIKRCNTYSTEQNKLHDELRITRSNLTAAQRDLTNEKGVSAQLRTALTALLDGKVTVDDLLKTGRPVQRALVVRSFYGSTHTLTYPYVLLKGEKEEIRKQVLDCFVDDHYREHKIQAIKNLREKTGLGLKESKDLVEWAIGYGEFAKR